MPAIVSWTTSAIVRAESDRFAEVLADADPDTRVPSCPDWTVADLLWHLGEVQMFWGDDRGAAVDDPAGAEDPVRPDGYDGGAGVRRSAARR